MAIDNGWFREESEDFPGQSFSLKIKNILHHTKSEFQEILVFESETFGNVLALDGIIQCTERDEFAYQEMISHLGLFSHVNPEKVLVIGGGDGGVLREVVKHPLVKEVTLCEIDKTVIELSKKYLPQMAEGFASSKVNINIGDGFEYLRNHLREFDVIITDSSDPDGPAEAFFQEGYFKLLSDSLRDGGIIVSMASENIWLKLNKLRDLRLAALKSLPNVQVSLCMIPSYTSGQIALLVASKDARIDLTQANREVDLKLKYYTKEIHSASYVLPAWARDIVYSD